ncbi:MAG: Omp28-related outer membrane protein [Saprospiraceae bacterium]|nr:Omp28-related outer membrane protein [Saprospiraceae bacterium]MCF8250065.1 Omp28-related outer membrane protein [Saprospiraceae bacterium]MCF8279527.1 Omp28-related outer membrane protein [Bacteroidales bacterium]MCF8311969.1 Omp28-related outer membrane protein [Saprospiraceae bacterium]MCF8440341.1 Omp28-related outer membrane protein [Saprospiraceae bacterium]
MKKYIFLLASAILFFSACEEIPPKVTGSMGGPVDPNPIDSQLRQVIIEEFTGVRCVQCPGGSAFIQDLLAIHGQQLIAVSIHAGDFSTPYSASLYDFRTEEGNQLLSYLDEPFGFPSAVVDRKLFTGQFDLQLGQGDWAGFIASEMAIAPKVRIGIEPGFNAGTRKLTADVTIYVDEAITAPDVRLSIMLTENNIRDLQITPSSSTPIPDYNHRHVLRDMLTQYNGDPISEPLSQGAEITRSFSFTMPADWKEENCEVIAIVSLAGASKEVLQAHQVHVVE